MVKKYLKRIVQNKQGQGSPPLPLKDCDPGAFEFNELEQLLDEELEKLNHLLPWASWVVDSKGRRFRDRFNENKRNEPEHIPDKRIVELHRRYDFSYKHVLELGCFEGNRAVALSTFTEKVTALDSRLEHVVKTRIRCAMAGVSPTVHSLGSRYVDVAEKRVERNGPRILNYANR